MIARLKWISLSLLLVSLISVSGCNVYEKFYTPVVNPLKVTNVSVNLHEQTSEGASYVILIDIENPNDVDLPLRQCDYSLTVGDQKSQRLTVNPKRTLPANGKQTVRVTTSIPGGATGAYKTSGSITYEPPGEIRTILTESKVPLPFILFDGEGQL